MPVATRRRRLQVDDEEVEEPTRRRRRALDVDEDDEEEAPRGRHRRAVPQDDDEEDDEEDVEEAPRGRRARAAAKDDEDEAEDTPRRGRRAAVGRSERGERTSRRVASGWGAYERSRAASSDFEKKFKPSSEFQVVALLEAEPFHAFARHWVEIDGGKRAFICPASVQYIDDDGEPTEPAECPLCDVGHKVNSPKAYLNVAILQKGNPQLAVWEIGPKVSEQLQMIDKSIGRRTKLTDIYILATAEGSGLNTKYHLEPLFEDDLLDLAEEERLPLKPLTDKQRDAMEPYDDSLYPVPTLKELNKIADEIA